MARPISVQLYSLRAEAAADFPGVLRRLADIGYAGVEPAGLHGLSPASFRSIIDECGLTVSSAHVGLPVGDQAQATLDEQEAIGNRMLISGGSPDDFSSADAVRRIADRFSEAATTAKARGMEIGYHNHWWEFESQVGDGTGYDVFLQHVDPSVFVEVDIYWAQVGGEDPAVLVNRLGDRVRYLHVKDGPIEPRVPMTAVGQGKVDIPSVLGANPNVEWHIVELDACGTDMFEAIAESHRYLTEHGLSTGR
jgi:sugar phosphate isomerase/epimerase